MQLFVGERIKNIRKAKKLTQAELANKINVDPKYLSRIETLNAKPSLDVLMAMAEALEVDIKDFFEKPYTKTKKELDKEIVENLKLIDIRDTRVIHALIKYFSLM